MGISSSGGAVRRWAALLALLLFLPTNGHEESPVYESVHHRVCCLQSTTRSPMFGSSGIMVKDWAELLNAMINNRPSPPHGETDSAACLHNFGAGNTAGVAYDDGPVVPPPENPTDDESTFSHEVATFRPEAGEVKKAQCATIALFVPRTSKRFKSSVDFFTAEFLDELTRRRPRIQMSRGIGEVAIKEDGGLEMVNYDDDEIRFYHYSYGYLKANDGSTSSFASEEELRKVIFRSRLCKKLKWESYECDAAFAFIEAVTGTRVPEEYELGLLTKDEIKNYLTIEKLRAIDFEKQMAKLKNEVDEQMNKEDRKGQQADKKSKRLSHNEFRLRALSWKNMVTLEALDKLTPTTTTRLSFGRRSRRRQTKVYPRKSRCPVRLTFLTESRFDTLRHEAAAAAATWNTPMREAFESTQIPRPRRRRSNSSNSKSRKGDGEVSPRQITDFLLVNSLLAVSNTKYSDFLASGTMHRLERMKMPLFAVCAENITWEPRQPPTGSSSGDWLSSNYRFTMTGSRHSSFGYQTLDELKNHTDLSDSSQCAILALAGVSEGGFKSLTRRPFDMIFGILTRKQMTTNWSIRHDPQKAANGSYYISAASGVDPWVLLTEKYSSSLTLGQMFDEVAELIDDNGSPQWPDDTTRRSSSKRSRSSRRA